MYLVDLVRRLLTPVRRKYADGVAKDRFSSDSGEERSQDVARGDTMAEKFNPGGNPRQDGVDPLRELCRHIVHRLVRERQVNFLALDFDCTILSIHTMGRWPGTAEELEPKIRPFFRALIPEAIRGGMHVAVVTFSRQVQIISRVLKIAFSDMADKIVIRGEDHSWEYLGEGSKRGKQAHMASAVEELTCTQKAKIKRKTTVLVDDDVNNISVALCEGVKAVWCNPRDLTSMVQGLQEV